MKESHMTGVFDVEGIYFQAICSCGWLSTTSFLEEVDLLRAIHAHEMAVFGERMSGSGNVRGLDYVQELKLEVSDEQ